MGSTPGRGRPASPRPARGQEGQRSALTDRRRIEDYLTIEASRPRRVTRRRFARAASPGNTCDGHAWRIATASLEQCHVSLEPLSATGPLLLFLPHIPSLPQVLGIATNRCETQTGGLPFLNGGRKGDVPAVKWGERKPLQEVTSPIEQYATCPDLMHTMGCAAESGSCRLWSGACGHADMSVAAE